MKIKTLRAVDEAQGTGTYYTHAIAEAVERFCKGRDIKNITYFGENKSLCCTIMYDEGVEPKKEEDKKV